MQLLILGLSSIVQRRVIPAAAGSEAINGISIASKSRPEPDEGWPKRGRFFSDYETALRESDADIVYLSLPNAMHEHWVLAALGSGKHVLVDKPAMLTREACQRGVTEARRSGRLLAEATVFVTTDGPASLPYEVTCRRDALSEGRIELVVRAAHVRV